MQNILLDIKNLTVQFFRDYRYNTVVKAAGFQIYENEIVGLVGESGSGKTISTLALTRILPHNAEILSGEAIFEENDLLKLNEKDLQVFRGAKISYIFQEPTMYLNPLITIGLQIAEAITIHKSKNEKVNVKNKAVELLRQVVMPLPEQVFFDYPHQLSGGMNQRVMIAQALASSPKLLIADEPTTNLDANTEKEILDLILNLQKEKGFSCIFITHNLGLVKKMCQRVYVMYQGGIVEGGGLDEIFSNPRHEHTKALINAYRRIG